MATAREETDDTLRILLVGRTGEGKSSTGNSILERDEFPVLDSSVSVTKTCKWAQARRSDGRRVEVTDTPGIFDTNLDNVATQKELLKTLALTVPGFHAIVCVLKKERFTPEVQNTVDLFFKWFGPNVEKYACVILTHTDDEKSKTQFLTTNPHPVLTALLQKCNHRVAYLNNAADESKKKKHVDGILKMVEDIREQNGSQHFTNVVYQLALNYVKEKYPSKFSNDSIMLLRNAGLDLQALASQFTLWGQCLEDTSVDGGEVVKSGTSLGNLSIFDDKTQKRIPPVTSPESSSHGESSENGEIDDKVLSLKDSSVSKHHFESEKALAESSHELLYSREKQGMSTGTNSEESASDSLRPKSSGKGRKIDPESFESTGIVSESQRQRLTPRDHVINFKKNVNQGDEELHGLKKYLKRGWEYCKKKFSQCGIL